MMTVDDALNIAVIHTLSIKHGIAVSEAAEAASILAAEVRRLRDEVNGLTGSLHRAESVLQNLMSFLSVNGCRAEIDPENAELRIRDGINMLVRPALERAELAEKALKEAQEQPAVAWMIHEYQGTGEKRLQFQPHIPSIRDDVTGPIVTALYARPVPAAPAVAVPAVPTDEQIHAAYRKALGQSIRERDMPEIRKFSHSLLQSAPQPSCWCRQCNPNLPMMILCPTCGNKRCPHANDHRNPCTGSNEPGQPGSAYPTTGDK